MRSIKFWQDAAHELYTWSRCDHENIVKLLGVALFRNQLAMISPWIDGGNAKDCISLNPTINRLQLVRIVVLSIAKCSVRPHNAWPLMFQCNQVIEGLTYLHESNIVSILTYTHASFSCWCATLDSWRFERRQSCCIPTANRAETNIWATEKCSHNNTGRGQNYGFRKFNLARPLAALLQSTGPCSPVCWMDGRCWWDFRNNHLLALICRAHV